MTTEEKRPSSKAVKRPAGGGTSRAAPKGAPVERPEPRKEPSEEDAAQVERPGLLYRNDLVVVIAGLALLAIGSLAHHTLSAPTMVTFHKHGLEFRAPGGWATPSAVPAAPTHLARELRSAPRTEAPSAASAVPTLHEIYTYAADSNIRLEVRVAPKPRYGNLRTVLSFERHNRYGELYRSIRVSNVPIRGRDWLRARFEYAYKAHDDDSPKVATGIEYAAVGGDRLYVVTMHGNAENASWLESRVAPTLSLPEAPGQGLLLPPPGDSRLTFSENEAHIRGVLPAVVMVLALDLVNGELVPVAGGSGTILSSDGSVLTNYHVLYDEEHDRLHDLFVIGRIRGGQRTPESDCAGHPDRSKLMPERDLALIRCDLDMSGRPWTPMAWPSAKPDLVGSVVLGERIWVIGFPDSLDGRLSVATGEVSGSTNEGGEVAFIRTTASITKGSSGGAAVDENGMLIGVPSAFRLRTRVDEHGAMPAGQVGMIRPIAGARPLIELAARGWTPTEGENEVEPHEAGASNEEQTAPDRGVVVSSVVRDAANDRPIAGAMVTVFLPGIDADDIDVNQLQEQALTWGQTNSDGNFTLRHRVPRGHAYTVAVTAKGYRPLLAKDVLVLDDSSPEYFDPWGYIRLER